MLRRALVAALALLLATALPGLTGAASAASGPDPRQVYVQSVTYGGSGCPNGTMATSFANDRKSLTLIFDSFVATSGPGIPATEHRKNCQLTLGIHVPQGFSYSIATFDYRGYVSLPAGLQASQRSTYSFAGEVEPINAGSRFSGPVAKDYIVRDTLGVVAWMPCGRLVPLDINAQVRITGNPSLPGQITVDSIDGKAKTILGFRWRNC